MTTIRLPNNWKPRDYQMPAWLAGERGIKRSLLIWHRRAGKDELALNKAAVSAHERPATYWHMLPEYAQARKAIWNAVNPHTGRRRIDDAFPHELRANTNEQEMFIRFKSGATWQVVGSDRYDSLVGASLGGVVLSEWALANPSAWAYLAPILAESNGWADFITTPRGRNHVKSMLDKAKHDPTWFTQVLTIDDTKAISREAVEQQRGEYRSIYGEEAGDALIDQEYWCSFEAAILGAYYGKEMLRAEQSGRITSVGYDSKLPVHTAWDIGVGDSTAIWFFQVHARNIRVIDYYQADGMGVEHYVEVLAAKPYKYEWDYVPHDAKVREWTQTGKGGFAKTRLEILISLGRKPRLIPQHKLEDGISAARRAIAVAVFDEIACAEGLECLRQYRREWDESAKVFRNLPKHDWTSHGADAWRYLSMAWQELKGDAVKKPKPIQGIRDMTFNQLMAAQAPERKRL